MSKKKQEKLLKSVVEKEDILGLTVSLIKEVADSLKVAPYEISKAQFLAHAGDKVSPWNLRNYGGFSSIQKGFFPNPNKDLVVIKKEKEISKYVRQLEEKAATTLVLNDDFNKIIKDALKELKIEKVKIDTPKVLTGTKMTMELMLSDIHYGKKTPTFNLKVCRERMQKLTEVFLKEKVRKEKEGYNVERVIIALIGDLIESYTMHGLESAVGCEFGNAQQVQAAITSLYHDVLLPIAKTGVKIDVPAVTGNHDRSEHSRTMNDPGLNNLTWIIYKSLEEMCALSGLKNVKFDIATGSYVILDIYKNKALYEHGDNTKGNSKKAFETLMEQRGRQNNVSLDFGRFGHWHEFVCFDRGRIIVNESVCGQDSYAKVKGYNSHAGQTINFYVETKNRPNSFYYSFPVALA